MGGKQKGYNIQCSDKHCEYEKKILKKRRVRNLPDSCLQTSLEQKEPSEFMKYKELSALSQVGVTLFPSF